VIEIRRWHPGWHARTAIASLAAAASILAMLTLPAGASAAEAPVCGGSLELNDEIPGIDPPGGLSYKFACNAQVLGFALFSSRQVDYFGTEVLVLDATSGEATPEQFNCEGPFPGSGFGCRGVANFGNPISGEFAIGRDPCVASKAKSDKFRVWVAATITQFDSVTNKPFTAVTHPFRLKAPDCPSTSKSKGQRSGKAGKRHHTNRKESRR
jgi:hypothetical protein